MKNEELMNKIKDELADVIIVSLNMANQLNLNIFEIVNKKINKNIIKYPVSKAKSNAKKYNEL